MYSKQRAPGTKHTDQTYINNGIIQKPKDLQKLLQHGYTNKNSEMSLNLSFSITDSN